MFTEKLLKIKIKEVKEMKGKRLFVMLVSLCALCFLTTSVQALDLSAAQLLGPNQQKTITTTEFNWLGLVINQSVTIDEHLKDANGNHVYRTVTQTYAISAGEVKLTRTDSLEASYNSGGLKISESTSYVNYTYTNKGTLASASSGGSNSSWKYEKYTQDGVDKYRVIDDNTSTNTDTYIIKSGQTLITESKTTGGQSYTTSYAADGTPTRQLAANFSNTTTYSDYTMMAGTFKAGKRAVDSTSTQEQMINNINLFDHTNTVTQLNYNAGSAELIGASYVSGSGNGYGQWGQGGATYTMALDMTKTSITVEKGFIKLDVTSWIPTFTP